MSKISRRTALKALGLTTAAATTTFAGYKLGENTGAAKSEAVPSIAPAGGGTVAKLFPFEGARQSGVITPPPEAVLIVALDTTAADRTALVELFKQISGRTAALMGGNLGDSGENTPNFPPADNTGELGFDLLNEGHLSIMLGLGSTIFEQAGKDRFGLAAYRPVALTSMPLDLQGDKLDATQTHGDILLQISSDHPLYNMHALRDILRHTKGTLVPRWIQPGFQRFFQAPAGQATARGLLGFKDGTANLDIKDTALMDSLVWTGSEEPYWAQGGTYLAVRKIREQLERWDRLTLTHQETAIGRAKVSGATLDNAAGGVEAKLPDYSADPNGMTVPLNAHIRKANPRAGADTEKRRMLRRGYLYFNGADKSGLLDAGFLFMGFCRNVVEQFEFVKRNYMSNRNYPQANTGRQDLDEYLFAVGGGYFFVPPGVTGDGRFLADALLLG